MTPPTRPDPWFKRPAVQIVACLSVYGALAWWGGPFVAVITSPLLAGAMAGPLMNWLRNMRHGMRTAVWREAQGSYYAYRDIRIHVVEDEDHCRWARMNDVRKVIGASTSDSMLAKTYPGACQTLGKDAAAYLRDDALVVHLCKSSDPQSLRMGHWAQRNINFPAERVRKQLGIRIAPLPPQAPPPSK